ncbi:MAG TPA: DUF4112 domain-containing protein [Pyrinomonadaceae bacterium]|nr:DUF4112 domain-containing protein [Pyrinomonadaceae bacterium]
MRELKDKLATVAGRAARKPEPVEVERSLERLSHLLDGLFRIPGTTWRFGLDAIVGLIPGVGDAATSLASFYILAAGVRYRVPKVTLLRMGANIGIDFLIGAIPGLGDLFDFMWKSNEMNMELIRKRATIKTPEEAKQGRKSDWLFVGLIILVLVGLLIGTVFLAAYIIKVIGRALGLW